MLIVAIPADNESRPKATMTFAVARSLRAALLASFADPGGAGEAPEVLRGRGDSPHAAVIGLPNVDNPYATGILAGIAIVLPHPRRLVSVAAERVLIEGALREFVAGPEDERRELGIIGVGNVTLAHPSGRPKLPFALQEWRWRRSSTTWASVTPVVHSRYRPNSRPESLLEQITADCADVGLPAPSSVEVLRRSPFTGAPAAVMTRGLPERWLGPLNGPCDHVRFSFEQPVSGPVLLGRARHFGVGLCLPEDVAA
jgi:CRISPR-associated protein Csb2